MIKSYLWCDVRSLVRSGMAIGVLLVMWSGLNSPLCAQGPTPTEAKSPPNVVLLFVDDLGYADIGAFGAKEYATPNLDRLAEAGMRFTDFCVPAAVCSASRAALLTGCYPKRVGIGGALGPRSRVGLHPKEVTLAELCRSKGYATACFGKWHLGHHPKFLPGNQGFDEFFGLPYSNDMSPRHPFFAKHPVETSKRKRGYPQLPLLEGDRVVDSDVNGDDQSSLTKRYTERSTAFIARHQDRPFFLYLPYTMVHVPLFASQRFKGRSRRGMFGDAMEEIDWSVGEIMEALRVHGLTSNTLVVFTSDNGPWLSYGNHAGETGGLREGKGTMWEGGVRVPTIMTWPKCIAKATECAELASSMDLFPTVAQVIGARLPKWPIDGKSLLPLMTQAVGARSPHEFLCGYGGGRLLTVRDRRWKLCFPHRFRTLGGRPGGTEGSPVPYLQQKTKLALFDLHQDPFERENLALKFPEEVARLKALADRARIDLGDRARRQVGRGVRQPGRLGPDDARLTW